MAPTSPAPLMPVVSQHAEEAALLRVMRTRLVRAPRLNLHGLARHDGRLAAHLDGLAVAGAVGWERCAAALANPAVGEVFAATVRVLEEKSAARLAPLIALAATDPACRSGLLSAFGWVSAQSLQGTGQMLLASRHPFERRLGIAACAMHRIHSGTVLDVALEDPDPALRAYALHVAGASGRLDLLAGCKAAALHGEAAGRPLAARAAALLGERAASVGILKDIVLQGGPARGAALGLVLRVIGLPAAVHLLAKLAQGQADARLLARGAGMAGDARYLPWLIHQTMEPRLARVAGEAFTFITGLDLGKTYLLYDRERPAEFESGPTDNPDDDNVAMDEDEGLPWPDPAKLQAWWKVNQGRFQPGVRYFLGAPPSVAHCRQVLRDGYQRQRIAAAEYLCLLSPGTQLFPTSAPAWRQQRWLRQMG